MTDNDIFHAGVRLRLRGADNHGWARPLRVGGYRPTVAAQIARDLANDLGGRVELMELDSSDGVGPAAGDYIVHVPALVERPSYTRSVATAQVRAGRPLYYTAREAGVSRETLEAWIADDDSVLAKILAEQEARVTIYLYELSGAVYLRREDGCLYRRTDEANPLPNGEFASNASGWVTGEWRPRLRGGWEPVEADEDTQGLTLVASWSRATGLRTLRAVEGDARSYLSA